MSLVDYPVIHIAIGAAILAVIYGLVMSRWIINLPAGNAKMKAIAGAIQDGAAAYLTRQYKTIALVGIILAVLIYYFIDCNTAIGFVIGAVLSGLMWLYRHECFCSSKCENCASSNKRFTSSI